MTLKMKFKRIGAMVMAIMMMLSGMTFASAEETTDIPEAPDESQEIINEQEELPDETACEIEQTDETIVPEDSFRESENEATIVEPDEKEMQEEQIILEDPDLFGEPIDPEADESEELSVAENDEAISDADEIEPDEPSMNDVVEDEPEEEPTAPPVPPLHEAIDMNGYAYVQSCGTVSVCSDKVLKEPLFSSDSGWNTWLATAYTENGVIAVYAMDENNTVIYGFIKETTLNDEPLNDEDISRLAEDVLCNRENTDIGEMLLFCVAGEWIEEDEPEPVQEALIPDAFPVEPEVSIEEQPDAETEEPDSTETESETVSPVENDPEEIIEVEPIEEDVEPVPDEMPENELAEETETPPEETETAAVDDPEAPDEDSITEDEPLAEPDVPEARELYEGDCVYVTTSTRVFSNVDETAFMDGFPKLLEGSFVKNAVVRIEQIETDEKGHVWYRVTYQYGDVLANGSRKWAENGSVYILAEETSATDETSLTLTDYALTDEQKQLRSSSGRKLMAATPMDGFTLKNISVNLGSFSAGQSGLYGSSGKDSAYPQLAKSTSYGTIYATPHYLSGYTVYCLEHTYDGPGEGSGSNMTPTGPYKLLDLNGYCNTSAGAGVSGFQFKESTMHAIGWVLRHTYPFMVLNRSDSNNNAWSRVAGQFAIREVIKKLEGSQYVRDYWKMSQFYSFSGGAPAVYLTYAKWLATNAIERASITGNITVSNKSVSISGSNYIGSVTLKTDADLIRIPRSVGTLTGNSGGKDSNYYYVKSGDTIKITSTKNKFKVTMESIPSDDEEAGFLIGVPSAKIQKVLVPTATSPYALKSKSVSFELTDGSITVTKKATDGTLLKGAVFELLSGTSVIASATTDANGKATFSAIVPGSYTVREKTAPQGFTLSGTNSQSVTVTAGVTATASFVNAPIEKRIRICKTDSETGKGLPGATFTVTRLSGPNSFSAANVGQIVATLTTNQNGIAETGLLPYGEYRITETGVPDGYLDNGYSTTQWIK